MFINDEMVKEFKGINFVNACSGGLRFRIGLENGESIHRRADTIQDGVHWIREYGIAAAGIAAGSSMTTVKFMVVLIPSYKLEKVWPILRRVRTTFGLYVN